MAIWGNISVKQTPLYQASNKVYIGGHNSYNNNYYNNINYYYNYNNNNNNNLSSYKAQKIQVCFYMLYIKT